MKVWTRFDSSINRAMSTLLDLDAYLARIGYAGPTTPTLETLRALHLAHALSIPFENLDLFLGRSIRLDLEHLQEKLVKDRRGGYCFEHNTLFAAVLERLGFTVTTLAARVRFGNTKVLPRTHMLLKVDLEDAAWLADVGFGGEGLLGPVPLVPGAETKQGAWTYRVDREGELRVLQSWRVEGWFDLYSFTLEPQYPVNYEMANWFVSTYPDSIFLKTMTVQKSTPTGRYALRGYELSVDRGGGDRSTRTIADVDLPPLLAEAFGLDFPPGTLFVAPHAGTD